MNEVVKGLALYVRKLGSKHGSPREFAKRMKALGLSWIALGAVWQEAKNGSVRHGYINEPTKCRSYLDACALEGIEPWVWGYPWLGAGPQFVDGMIRCSGDHKRLLLDPELGANPTKSTSTISMGRANAFARELVTSSRAKGAVRIGLSTYGVVPKWFPLTAFLKAELDFVGGQTYTDDAVVDRSIASFLSEISKAELARAPQLVPNFGLYSWDKGVVGKKRAYSKTPEELDSHFMEFIDEGEPVTAMIGWAENFVSKRQEPVIQRFARVLARGACALPSV